MVKIILTIPCFTKATDCSTQTVKLNNKNKWELSKFFSI